MPKKKLHVRKIVAALSVSALMLTAAGCGSKDDTSDESKGSPVTSSEPSASTMPEMTMSPSPSASASSDSALGTVVTITLVKGKPEKLLDDVKISKGDKITVKATSDEAHEIHIHGYDKMLDLKPGEVEKVTFTADKAGSYVVEVEDTKKELFSIQVK